MTFNMHSRSPKIIESVLLIESKYILLRVWISQVLHTCVVVTPFVGQWCGLWLDG